MDSDLLSQLLDPKSPINLDGLLDAITALVIDCKAPSLKNKNLENFVARYQNIVEELSRQRLKGTDFCTLKVIGRGSFGEVQLVRHTKSKNIYAMKLLDKDVMLQRSASFWEERDIMTHANSDWIVKLHYAFQDHKFLYIVMEYLPGGDLLNLLQNYDVSEKWVRFYAAELVEAITCLHDMGYIHRDVKPDNILVTRSGHIKLADFGTCIKIEANGTAKCLIAVGTADYLAPEVLKHQGNSIIFGPEVDWWSLGICIYEMFYEYPPFYDQSTIALYSNITKHEETLVFPEEPSISSHAKDIIKLFLSKAEMRLGRNGPDEIRAHPFFNDSEWTFDTLKEASPPFVPELKGEEDTKNFMEIEAQLENNIAPPLSKVFSGSQLPFIGFTYGSDLSPINEFTKLNENKINRNIQNTVVVSSNEDIQKDLEAQLDSFKEKLDQMQNLLENEKSARRTVETNLSEIENGKLIQEEVIEDNRKLKIKLETAQLEKRTLIRKLEELLAKKTQDPKDKGPSKNDIKTRDNKIRRLEAENGTLRSDLQRELNRYQDLEGDLYNVRDENNKLVIEVRQLQEELKQRETLARLAGPLDSTICQGNLFLKNGKGSKDWKNVWARLDTLTLQLFDELGGRLDQIDVSQIILTRYLTAADLRAKKEQIERMFQILYYDASKNAMQSTFMALTRDDCNTWMQHLKKIVPEKK